MVGTNPETDKSEPRHTADDQPFCALVFKIVADPYVGRLAYFRVYSGVVEVGETVQNSTKRRKERLGRVLRMYADRREELTEVRAGDIGATLGLSTWIFLDILKQNSVIYMLPVFVYAMLVAVGSDYNIFLVSRIREENRTQPLREAICSAIANTGGVITSCGIILAGTFATLTTAPLQLVFQVGAAIGLGVLIDTFLVRAVLIPSIATLIGKWNWWPFKN